MQLHLRAGVYNALQQRLHCPAFPHRQHVKRRTVRAYRFMLLENTRVRERHSVHF
jgi:hypothetical protein